MERLVWIYLINSALMINHEIDSAYRREWDLIGLPGGITLFIIMHLVMIPVILYGLLALFAGEPVGYWISLLLGIVGAVAFALHYYFIKKGDESFNNKTSLLLLAAILITSITQIILSALAITGQSGYI